MTPERIQEARSLIVQAGTDPAVWKPASKALDELCDAALRLADIENAGDEEVELMLKTIGGDASDSEKTNAFLWLRWIFKSRNATISDLRAKLGEAEKLLLEIKKFYGLKNNPDGVPPWLWQIIAESEVGDE